MIAKFMNEVEYSGTEFMNFARESLGSYAASSFAL